MNSFSRYKNGNAEYENRNKINRVHQRNLDLEDSEGKQWERPDHVQYHRFRQREAILCAIGSEKQEFP